MRQSLTILLTLLAALYAGGYVLWASVAGRGPSWGGVVLTAALCCVPVIVLGFLDVRDLERARRRARGPCPVCGYRPEQPTRRCPDCCWPILSGDPTRLDG